MQSEEKLVLKQTAPQQVLPLNRAQRRLFVVGSLLLGDFTAAILAFWGAYQIRFRLMDYPAWELYTPYYIQMTAIALLILLVLFWLYQLYSPKVLFGGLQEYARIFNAITTGAVALVLLDFFLNRQASLSRGWLLILWGLALLLFGLQRFAFRRLVYALRQRGHFLTPALVVNADAEGLALLEQLEHWRVSGLRVRGFLDEVLPLGQELADDIKVLGRYADLQHIARQLDIEEIIVATGAVHRLELLDIYQAVSTLPNVKLRFSSGLFEMLSTGLHIKEMANVPLIEVDKVRIAGVNALMKAAMDYGGALFGLLILSPVYAIIALLIRLDSPGPIFYKHRVIGLNGQPFDAIKFRTMSQDGDQILNRNPELRRQFEENFKLKDDPRVTRVGRFLRRTSLDELPQLINVLRGQMSIVGPRFISPPETPKYGRFGLTLFTVKPGITGLWQISGRSDVTYEERIRLDMYYIRNWTIWLDIYLLLATLPAVLSRKGAY
jgi:exopolysaccharide biosynthesis polyprenyl glycosylphosphotransferase